MEFTDSLVREVEQRRDDLVALAQDLIRIPTLNPPGKHYREICERLSARLEGAGFAAEFVRAIGRPVTATATRAGTWF